MNKVEKKKHGKLVFEFYWQRQQQATAHYIENTQLHAGNQVDEEHPDVCDEESQERSELFIQSLANDDVKKKKIKQGI